MALAGLASAYAGQGDPEQAAATAGEALGIARAAGSVRIINVLTFVERSLAVHQASPLWPPSG
jgi:Na+-driven multidrug efflux pump